MKEPMNHQLTEGFFVCRNCGYSPTNRADWCDLGCGRDYNHIFDLTGIVAQLLSQARSEERERIQRAIADGVGAGKFGFSIPNGNPAIMIADVFELLLTPPAEPENIDDLLKCQKCGEPFQHYINPDTGKWDEHSWKPNCEHHNKNTLISVG